MRSLSILAECATRSSESSEGRVAGDSPVFGPARPYADRLTPPARLGIVAPFDHADRGIRLSSCMTRLRHIRRPTFRNRYPFGLRYISVSRFRR